MKLYPKTSSERRRKKKPSDLKTNWTVEHEAGNDLLEAQRVLEDTRGRVNSISTIFFQTVEHVAWSREFFFSPFRFYSSPVCGVNLCLTGKYILWRMSVKK